MAEQVEQGLQGGASRCEVWPFGLVELGLDAGSLVAEVAQACGEFVLRPVGVADQVEVLILAAVEFGELIGEPFPVTGVGGLGVGEYGVHAFGDAGAQVGGDGDGCVVALDGILNGGYGYQGQVAYVAVPAAAVVEVLVAVPVLAAIEDEPLFAAGAPYDALEVVVVDACSCPSAALVVEDVLDGVEEVLADQWFVPAFVFDALVGDVSEVVAVAQDLADLVDGDLSSCGVLFGWLRAESGVGERVPEIAEAVGACCVEFESHFHEGCAFGIDSDGADFPAVVFLADVEVADWCSGYGSSVDHFLAHLVGDVRAGCAGLVFVHGVQYGSHEVADRGVFGVVHYRDEYGPCFAEVAFGDGRVDGVAVHPGPGVDDHVIDVFLSLDAGHHFLESRASFDMFRCAARLYVFGDDFRAEFGGSFLARRALGGKRDAFGVVVGVDLTR